MTDNNTPPQWTTENLPVTEQDYDTDRDNEYDQEPLFDFNPSETFTSQDEPPAWMLSDYSTVDTTDPNNDPNSPPDWMVNGPIYNYPENTQLEVNNVADQNNDLNLTADVEIIGTAPTVEQTLEATPNNEQPAPAQENSPEVDQEVEKDTPKPQLSELEQFRLLLGVPEHHMDIITEYKKVKDKKTQQNKEVEEKYDRFERLMQNFSLSKMNGVKEEEPFDISKYFDENHNRIQYGETYHLNGGIDKGYVKNEKGSIKSKHVNLTKEESLQLAKVALYAAAERGWSIENVKIKTTNPNLKAIYKEAQNEVFKELKLKGRNNEVSISKAPEKAKAPKAEPKQDLETPAPTEPAVSEPTPTVETPAPTEPTVSEPTPTVETPAPTEPAVSEPTPTVETPVPTEPTVSEPTPTVETPAPTEPTASEPTPTVETPAPTEPTASEPTPTVEAPAPTEPPARTVTEDKTGYTPNGVLSIFEKIGREREQSIAEERKLSKQSSEMTRSPL